MPSDGFSDIDLFLFCDSLPAKAERAAVYGSFPAGLSAPGYGEREDPHWGLADSLVLEKQETYLMFFTENTFSSSIDSILSGERTQREDNYFYPTGRCAAILGMYTFYDPDGLIRGLKVKCASYPDALRIALLESHLPKIDDEEDFQRAVLRRDALFYHATIDLALDHFLQALFALNRAYFPSRKRSLEFIRGFSVKPEECEARLLNAVRLGAKAETLSDSYRIWKELCADLFRLASCEQ